MGTEEFNRTSSPHHHPDYTALFHSTAPWILSRTMDLCHEQKLKRRCWGSGPADWGDTQRGYTLCAYIEIYAYHVLYLHIYSTLNQIEMFRVKIWKEPGMPYRDTIFSQHIFISSNCSRGCLVGSLWRIQTLIMRLVRTRLRTNQGLIWQALPLSLRKWNLSETTWGMNVESVHVVKDDHVYDILKVLLSRTAEAEGHPSLPVGPLREELSTLYQKCSRVVDDVTIHNDSWAIRKIIAFIKMKVRRCKVSTATLLYFDAPFLYKVSRL